MAKFGLTALVFNPFVSCNSNARLASSSATAGEMRMYRLLRNQRLANCILSGIQNQHATTTNLVLAVDFSNFGKVAVLAAAIQTTHGRAMPFSIDTMVSNTQGHHITRKEHSEHKENYKRWKQLTGGDQFDMVIRFVQQIDQQVTTPPGLVFDRGFGNRRLLTYLFARQGYSYIRLRDTAKITVLDAGEQYIASELGIGDYMVEWLGQVFRLVITCTAKATRKNINPWVIATNDMSSSVSKITKLYYHRFEIEETFRDWKSLLGLRIIKLQRWQSLYCILAFASLAILLAWYCYIEPVSNTNIPTDYRNNQLGDCNLKKSLSFVRKWQETVQHIIRYKGCLRLQR